MSLIIILVIFQGTTTQTRADQWDDILAANKITIGMDTTYEPFQWMNNSVVVGYEVDLSTRIGDLLGVNVEIISTNWVTIIPDLQSANFDIILSAMTITPARQAQIDFTIPYFYDSLGILVQSDNAFNIENVNDANNTLIKVGSVTGTNADSWVTTNLVNATKISYVSSATMNQAFNNGDIDVLVNPWYTIGYEIENGNLNGEIIEYGFEEYNPFGIGVRKGEARFLSMLNNALSTMFFDGTYKNVTESWFNVTGLNVVIDQPTITETDTDTVTGPTETVTGPITTVTTTEQVSGLTETLTATSVKTEDAPLPLTPILLSIMILSTFKFRKKRR